MNIVLTCILGYVALQLAIAFWFARRNRTEEDYLLAGRSLGPWMTTFAVFATWFGAETCIGAAGEAYHYGITGVIADPFGYTLGIILMGLLFAASLWKRGLMTLADLFRQRYGGGVERLTALVIIPGSVMWAAAQVRAFGQVLSSVSELALFASITFAAVVVITYTVFGGMWANALTDLVQGIVLVLGIFMLGAVFVWIGGLQDLAALPPERFDIMHERSWPDALNTLAVPVFSTLVAHELVARILASRNQRIAKGATTTAGFLYLAVGSVPVMIGLAGASVIGEDIEHEQVLSLFAQQNLPMPLYILFLGALVSAIMSTLAGALLVAGALAGHNLIKPLVPHWSEAQRLRTDRIMVLVFGIAAYLIALASDGVYELVMEAAALGSSGVLVMMVFSIWGERFGGAPSAYAALLTGVGVYLYGEHVLEIEAAYITSLAASLLAYITFALLLPRREPAATS